MTTKTTKTAAVAAAVAAYHAGEGVAAATINYATANVDELFETAGAEAYRAGEGVAAANKQRATALDMLIVAMVNGGLHRNVAVDVLDAGGNVTESSVETLGSYDAGFRNVDGSDNRKKQGAFRARSLSELFRVPGDQSAGAKATWALVTGKALPTAVALVQRNISASLNSDGKLVLDGGIGSDVAEKLKAAAAKSTSALVKAAKGDEGSNREAPQNDKSEGSSATPSEITRAVVALAKLIAKGDATACAATLSNLRAIAALVASNPDAFADD